MRKIFISGGHFSPALAVIEELRKSGPSFAKASAGKWQIFYLGRKFAMESEQSLALEFQELSHSSNLRYLSLMTGRLQRKFFVRPGQSVKALLKTPAGFIQSFWWLLKFRPDVVLSFGGYPAVPVVFGAWLFGIPIVTHEQTLAPGLANKIIAFFADKICVSWPQTMALFPEDKTVLTGNPIRQEIKDLPVRLASGRSGQAGQSSKIKIIYITGGSQGAHVINAVVEEILPKLLRKYQIIHQTGDAREFGDFERLNESHGTNESYEIHKFLSTKEAAQALGKADLVISRAGANTVTELAFLGKPAILIPLPSSSSNEQYLNAKMLVEAETAEILEQKDLTGENLYAVILQVSKNLAQYQKKAPEAQRLIIPNAAGKVVTVLASVTRPRMVC